MQSIRGHVHFIWADRIVMWLAILIAGAGAICWMLVAVAAGTAGANHVVLSFGSDSGLTAILVLTGFWVLLRAADFIAGGSTYRMFATPPEPEPKPAATLPATDRPMAAM
jgi:hypothetical protein